MLNTAQILKDLETVLSLAFNQSYEATSTQWPKFTMTQNFDASGLALGWLGEFEDLREWIGDRVLGDIDAYCYLVKPKNFERTKAIDVNDLNDTLIANTASIMRGLGEAAKRHPQKLLVKLLRDGHLPASTCYDGQPFFSATHPGTDATGAAITQSNTIEGTGPGWYAIRGDGNGETSFLKPFVFGVRTGQDYSFKTHGGQNSTMEFMQNKVAFGVDARIAAAYGLWQFAVRSAKALTADNLEEALQTMAAIKGDHGVEIENTPTLLVVPESLRSAAEKIINTTKAGDNIYYKRLEIVVLKGL